MYNNRIIFHCCLWRKYHDSLPTSCGFLDLVIFFAYNVDNQNAALVALFVINEFLVNYQLIHFLSSIIAFHDIIFLKATSINHVGERLRRILQKSLLLHKNDPQKGGLIYECLQLNSHNLGGTWEFVFRRLCSITF